MADNNCTQEPGTCSGDASLGDSLNTVPECSTEGEVCTFCDGDRIHNVWIEGGDPETGEGGACLLDTMDRDEIIYVLQRDERSRADLRRVTTNPELLAMADEIPRLPTAECGDQLQSSTNQNSNSIPFYSIFRGQPPFAQ